MATNHELLESEYYPPRARWYGFLFSPWHKVQRRLGLESIHLPSATSVANFILSLVIPGYAFFVNDRRLLGKIFLGVYALSVVIFGVALGYTLSGLAFGLMISAHASSIIFLETRGLRNSVRFGFRVVIAVFTLLGVWQLIYAPAIRYAEKYWVRPLQIHGKVIVVNGRSSARNIRRGDSILYSTAMNQTGDPHGRGGAVYVRDGLGFGPVLGISGDHVKFSTNAFAINGVTRPLLPHMPATGELIVPENHWFIWPALEVSRGQARESTIAAIMQEMSLVSEDHFLGKPFERWFGRRQTFP